jgi:pyruvate,water dikinase
MMAEPLTVAVDERMTPATAPGDQFPAMVWLGEPAADVKALVGGKVAPLSRLAAQFRVPPGFCLTTHAYDLASTSARVADDGRLPDRLRHAVAVAYQRLAEITGIEQPAVAVRSSAVDEDGANTSFAGQHDTYLNVVGLEAVCEAIVRCWASASSPRALEYRRQHGLATEGGKIAVLVQHLVLADVSGVVFSANPLSGCRDETVINVSWGLGESIVGGSVTPDTYVVRTAGALDAWSIAEHGLAEKRRMTVAIPGGTREVDVPRLLWSRSTLEDGQIVELARLARDLEATMGWPVDLEVAVRDDTLYLLQCRPITTLDAAVAARA